MHQTNHHPIRINIPVLILIFAFNWQAFSRAQTALGLGECHEHALKTNNQLKSTLVNQALADAQIAQAQAQRLPGINMNGMYTRIGKITSFTIPMGPTTRTLQFGTPNRMSFDVKLQMPLFTWGRIGATIALAETGKSLSIVENSREKVRITGQVLQAYYWVAFHAELLRLNRMKLKRAQSLQKITQKRYSAGMVPRLETLRAGVQVKNAESAVQDGQDNLRKSKIVLARTTGLEHDNFSIRGHLNYLPVEVDASEILNRALNVRSELKVFRIQEQMGAHQIRLARSANKPNLFLFSGYNVTNGFDPMEPDRFIDNWNAGLQLVVPLFDGFATRHRVQEAELKLKNVTLQANEIRSVIRMQVRQALVTLKQAEHKIIAQQKNIVLARETLQVAETQYQNGLVSSLDVLNAQKILAQNELLYNQAIFNHILARISLCQSIEDFSWFESELK